MKWDELLTLLNSKDESEWTEEERQKFKSIAPHFEDVMKEEDKLDPREEADILTDKSFDHLTNADYANHMTNMEQIPFAPPEFLNYNVNWRKTKAFPDENLVHFIKPTHDEYRSATAEVCLAYCVTIVVSYHN